MRDTDRLPNTHPTNAGPRPACLAVARGPPCTQFGPAWPSLGGWSATSSGVRDPGSSSEDCLYLNVYAPTNADEAPCQALLRRR